VTEITEERFLADVREHEMHVLRDEGVYRHLRFSKPGTMDDHFDLVTWPGYLCFTGDRGTYVFWRKEDMLTFFHQAQEGALRINPYYWSQKVEAQDKNGGVFEYDHRMFTRYVLDDLIGWLREGKRDGTLSKESRRELWESVCDEVLCLREEGETLAKNAAMDFTIILEGNIYSFSDVWEWDCRDYTNCFLWACYAIAWGVSRYGETC
jgi:hypothetical protein